MLTRIQRLEAKVLEAA